MSAYAAIAQIDKQITAVRRELRSLVDVDPMSAASWQAAWDQYPDLRQRETELFRQRGVAQLERDAAEARATLRGARLRAPKECPTCGCRTLAVAS